MKVINVDKFIKNQKEAFDKAFLSETDGLDGDEQFLKELFNFRRGVNCVLELLKHSDEIFEIEEIAKDITYPNGCDDADVYCDKCEHHRSVSWCSKAISNLKEVNPDYETGWMDGVEAAEKNLNGYDVGYADGWDEGWKDCYESFKTAIERIFEDNK